MALCVLSTSSFAAQCLYVSSYHAGYEWNDGIERGIESTLEDKCELDKFYMDTKRNTSPEFAQKKAKAAKEYIEKTSPDVVIACDDNASKYLVKPYYKDAALPFAFCGINWTVEEYGYPYSNVTGMIEVAPILPLLKLIQDVIEDPVEGIYLSADVLTEHKDYERYRRSYEAQGVTLHGKFVNTLDDWKREYIDAQRYDFIVLNNNSGIHDWNKLDAKDVALKHSKTLTVTNYDWMMPYSMLAMTKLPEEQGEWAAQIALAIIDGQAPVNIPVIVNRRWNIYVNPNLVERSKIRIPAHIMHKAIKIEN